MILLLRPMPRAAILAVTLAATAGILPIRAARAGGGDEEAEPADPEARLESRLSRGPKSSEPKAVAEWSAAMAAEGRARLGTPLGSALLAAAANALSSRRMRPADALALWREAQASFAESAVGRTQTWWEVARLLSEAGDAEGGLAALDEFERRMAGGPPVDVPGRDRLLFASLEDRAAGLARLVRARDLAALGRHADAASIYESLADHPAANGPGAAALLDDAAWAAWRAGDAARARRAIDRSIAGTTDDEHLVARTHWRLRARHGLLDDVGNARLPARWPGDAFLVDLRAALSSLSGRRRAFELALQGATIAMLSSHHDEALELFAWAFGDPSFQEEAKDSEIDRRRLLTGADEALRAGRPDLALAWLSAAERFAGAPIPGTERLRIDIEEAVQAKEAKGAGAPPEADPAASSPSGPSNQSSHSERKPAARLGPFADPGATADGSPTPAATSAPSGWGWAWPAIAVAVALAAALVGLGAALLRRRRARPG